MPKDERKIEYVLEGYITDEGNFLVDEKPPYYNWIKPENFEIVEVLEEYESGEMVFSHTNKGMYLENINAGSYIAERARILVSLPESDRYDQCPYYTILDDDIVCIWNSPLNPTSLLRNDTYLFPDHCIMCRVQDTISYGPPMWSTKEVAEALVKYSGKKEYVDKVLSILLSDHTQSREVVKYIVERLADKMSVRNVLKRLTKQK